MINTLRSEWTKLWTLRSTYVVMLVALAVNLLIPLALLVFGDMHDKVTSREGAILVMGGFTTVPAIPAIPALLLGILCAVSIGNEYRYNTITPTLLATPDRPLLLMSKIMVCIALSAVLTLASMSLNTLVAFIGLQTPVPLAGQQGALAGFVGFMVGWGLLGLGLGLVFKKTLPAVATLFLGAVVLENLIRGMAAMPALDFLKKLEPYLPFSAGTLMGQPAYQQQLGGVDVLSRPENALIFGSMVLAVVAAGWVRFLRTDA